MVGGEVEGPPSPALRLGDGSAHGFVEDLERAACAHRAEGVDRGGRQVERQRHRFAGPAQLERLEDTGQFGTRGGLHPGNGQEAPHDVAQAIGRFLVARLRPQRATDAAVDMR